MPLCLVATAAIFIALLPSLEASPKAINIFNNRHVRIYLLGLWAYEIFQFHGLLSSFCHMQMTQTIWNHLNAGAAGNSKQERWCSMCHLHRRLSSYVCRSWSWTVWRLWWQFLSSSRYTIENDVPECPVHHVQHQLRFLRSRSLHFDLRRDAIRLRRSLRCRHEMQPLHLHRQQEWRNLHLEKSLRFRRILGLGHTFSFALRLRLRPQPRVN
jgi:hypothetical protein